MVTQIITWILLAIITIIFIIRYKKINSEIEKIALILLIVVFSIPAIIYYLDKYNIPEFLKLNENIDSQSWLSFISEYYSGIIAEMISAIVLIIVLY